MKQRIDGIYKCWHPKAFVEGGTIQCPECPYTPRPSTTQLGAVIAIRDISPQDFHIDRERDQFIIMGDRHGRN